MHYENCHTGIDSDIYDHLIANRTEFNSGLNIINQLSTNNWIKIVTGGKRKTRKQSKGASSWVQSVMRVFKELKAKNPATKFGEALKEASKRKKSGKL